MSEVQFCSAVSTAYRESAIGTAPHHLRYLFVEAEYPWPHNAIEAEDLPKDLQELLAKGETASQPIRMQIFNSEKRAATAGVRRFFYFYLSNPMHSEYTKEEYLVPEDKQAMFVKAIVDMDDVVLSELLSQYRHTEADEMREWFVCTHGGRDFCCGKWGAPIYSQMQEKFESQADRYRVWRTSHIGGHRFAPTAVEFPSGRYWARLEEEMLEQLVAPADDFTSLAPHYRGWSGFNPMLQRAENEILKQRGWPLTNMRRRGEILEQNDEQTVVQLSFYGDEIQAEQQKIISGEIAVETYRAKIEHKGAVPMFGCNNQPKDIEQYEVIELVQV